MFNNRNYFTVYLFVVCDKHSNIVEKVNEDLIKENRYFVFLHSGQRRF